MANSNNGNTAAGTAARWVIGSALWLGLGGVILFVIPVQKKTFDEYGLNLPAATQLVIDVSMLFADFWWLLAPGLLAGIVIAGFITYFVRHRSDSGFLMALWLVLLIGVPLVLHGLVAISLNMVHLKLAEGLSK